MFGHVKRVFLRTSSPEEPGDIWIQASSGMYVVWWHNLLLDLTQCCHICCRVYGC